MNLPGLRLHPSTQRPDERLLGRDRSGQLALDFRFDGDAEDVDYVDYH
jgi:hypothetical protein